MTITPRDDDDGSGPVPTDGPRVPGSKGITGAAEEQRQDIAEPAKEGGGEEAAWAELKATWAAVEAKAAEHGLKVGGKPYLYKPKPKAAYELWKRVLQQLLARPERLEWGPTQFAAALNELGGETAVTRDMFYDPLNKWAAKGAQELLASHGVQIAVKKGATLRGIQQELLARRGTPEVPASDEFTGHFKIVGDTVYVNGRPFQIQHREDGPDRIKRGRAWLVIDTIRAFCAD